MLFAFICLALAGGLVWIVAVRLPARLLDLFVCLCKDY